MTLPEVELDDRDFQSLVSEARRRIAERCPEWTDHNVSDPGVTLLETFAWMTDQLIYRVNQIPDKLEVALLNLLDVDLEPSSPASTRLRFLLAPDRKSRVWIPAETEVATSREGGEAPIVFATTEGRAIEMLGLDGMAVSRAGVVTAIPVDEGVARPSGEARAIFAVPPRQDDALYLGSRAALTNLVVEVRVKCGPAQGLGIDPDEPPWRWEAYGAGGRWNRVKVLSDTTGGFNLASGVVRLELAVETLIATIGGRALHWLRCSPGRPRSSEEEGYTAPPELGEVSLSAVGASLPAEHSTEVGEEILGYSDGTTGQSFRLVHRPALPLRGSHTLQVQDPAAGEARTWTRVDSFADSGALDEHFKFDPTDGEIRFGPAIRIPGGWRQHGAIPPLGAKLWITRYRYGGGHVGNLDAGRLVVLRQAIPGVASVTNARPALGGLEGESVPAARLRAPREVRTRERAVTAGDFELLAVRDVSRVARARCLPAAQGKAVNLHVLPEVALAPGKRRPKDLVASSDILEEAKLVLERVCLLGTSVHVTPAKLKVVTVAVEVVVDGRRSARSVEEEVAAVLYRYLDPYVGGAPRSGAGWPWGRGLARGELDPIVRHVNGVRSVELLRIYESGAQQHHPTGAAVADRIRLAPYELVVSGRHRVRALPGPRGS